MKLGLFKRAINEILQYWSVSGKQLVFLSSMPEFPHFKEQAIANYIEAEEKYESGEVFTIDHQRSESSMELLSKVAGLKGIKVLDMGHIFCNMVEKNQCLPVNGDTVLMVDDSHLSVSGASLFGAALATDLKKIQ